MSKLDADKLKQNVVEHLRAAHAMKDQWPADVNEAYASVAHHVLMAILDRGTYLSADDIAGFLKLLLDGLGFLLVDAFLHGLGRALDQVLRFLQAQAREFANDLDDADLLVGRVFLEDDRELGLLLGRRGGGTGGSTARGNHRDRSSGGDAPLLLQRVLQFDNFHHAQLRELADDIGN